MRSKKRSPPARSGALCISLLPYILERVLDSWLQTLEVWKRRPVTTPLHRHLPGTGTSKKEFHPATEGCRRLPGG